MLRPIIMIGCGGSGQKAVRYVRDAVKRHLEHNGWKGGFPQAWQFLGVDTLTSQEDQTIPPFPAKDYISVSLDFPTFQGLNTALEESISRVAGMATKPDRSESSAEGRCWTIAGSWSFGGRIGITGDSERKTQVCVYRVCRWWSTACGSM